jgi:hypothetical protein
VGRPDVIEWIQESMMLKTKPVFLALQFIALTWIPMMVYGQAKKPDPSDESRPPLAGYLYFNSKRKISI